MHVNTLTKYIDELLAPGKFQDKMPNGLQISGRTKINKIVTGVSASQELLERAINSKADAVLVHHGYFWKKENPRIIGIKKSRIAAIINNNLNLLAYHLCLDAHNIYGNNAQIAKLFKFKIHSVIDDFLYIGTLEQQETIESFSNKIETKLKRKPFIIKGKKQKINSIAWCSGAAQFFIEQASLEGCDAFLTGEISENTVYAARELGISFFAAGHYATERYGISALGEHLAKKFSIEHQFIEIDNPI